MKPSPTKTLSIITKYNETIRYLTTTKYSTSTEEEEDEYVLICEYSFFIG